MDNAEVPGAKEFGSYYVHVETKEKWQTNPVEFEILE